MRQGIVSEDEAAAQLPPLRAEKAELETKLKMVGEPVKVVELHPTAIKECLATVDQLEAALKTEAGDEHPAVEPIRKLIDRVIPTPAANGPLHIRVEGKLNSLIGGGQYPAMSLGGIIGSGGPLPPIPPNNHRAL